MLYPHRFIYANVILLFHIVLCHVVLYHIVLRKCNKLNSKVAKSTTKSARRFSSRTLDDLALGKAYICHCS